MQDQFAASLRKLVIPPGVLAWLQEAVAESDLNERGAREREVKRLEEQHRRVEAKLDMMYEDKLDGRISSEAYDRRAQGLRLERSELLCRINEIRSAAPPPVQHAIDLMDLTSRAADLFLVQPTHEKQQFLRLVLKSASWQDSRLQTEFEEPFNSLRRSNQLSTTQHKENGMAKPDTAIWLPGMDSNHDSRLQRPLSYH